MKRLTDRRLNNILDDKTSGSTELVLKLNRYFSSICGDTKKIRLAAVLSKKELSNFTIITDYLARLSKIIRKDDPVEIKRFTINYQKEHDQKYKKLYANALPYLRNCKTVITLSNSKTLIEIFKLMSGDVKSLKIIICESRPKLEGRLLAKALLNHGIKVELITDAEVSLFVPKADALILGADSILRGGNVINKTGSMAAAVLCNFYKKPVYVVSSKDKISGGKSYRPIKEKSSEIWKYSDNNLKVTNIYFEEIEAGLITKIITD